MDEQVFFYRLLGTPGADGPDGELSLGPPQARKVFVILLLEANRLVSAGRIADELWGEQPPASARVQIQGLISRLRRALRGDTIRTGEHGYLLRVAPGGSDVDLFASLTADGRRALADANWARAADLFRQALGLWRGPMLGGLSLPASSTLVSRFDELRAAAVEDYVDARLHLGEYAAVLLDLRELLEEQPFRERACGLLMTALARSGRCTDAVRHYHLWQGRLRDEFGIEPSPALRELHGGILRAEPGVRTPTFAAFHAARK